MPLFQSPLSPLHRSGVHAFVMGMACMVAARTAAAQAAAAAPIVDLSSPKSALTTVYMALKAGDVATARRCLVFKNAAQAELFDMTYTQLYAPLKLMHAFEARFGEAGRKPFALTPLEKSLNELLEKVKTVEIQAEGDSATVKDQKAAVNPSAESALTGITFKKQNNEWKLNAATFMEAAGDLPPDQMRFLRGLSSAISTAIDATTTRLAHGDFKTADEAFADYQARVQAGTRAAAIAATQKAP